MTDEQVQDIIGSMVSDNTETNIAVTYDDNTGKLNFVSTDTNTDTNTQLSTEEVQDIMGATWIDGTNTTVVYDDVNGTLKINSTDTNTDTNTQLTDEQVQDIIGAMVTDNTETNIAVTYDDNTGKLNFVSTDTNTDTNTQRSDEEIQDVMGATWIDGTNTTVVYDDVNGTLKINSVDTNTDTNTQRTDAEINALIDANTNGFITSYTDTNTQRSDEEIRDVAAAQWVNGSNTTVVKDDAANTIKINSTNTNTQRSDSEINTLIGNYTDAKYLRSNADDTTTGSLTVQGSTSSKNVILTNNADNQAKLEFNLNAGGGSNTSKAHIYTYAGSDYNTAMLFGTQSKDDSGNEFILPSFRINDSDNDVYFYHGIEVTDGVKITSGTSSQFLKADGTLDSNTYLTSYTDTNTQRSDSEINTLIGNYTDAKYLRSNTSDTMTGTLTVDGGLFVENGGDQLFNLVYTNGNFKLGDIDSLNNDIFIENDGSNFKINAGGTTTLTADLNNRIGIGTDSPSDTLEVEGGVTITSSTPTKLLLNNTKNGSWTQGESLGLLEFYGNDSSGGGAKVQSSIDIVSHDIYGAHFNMLFKLSKGSTGNLEVMKLTGEGNLSMTDGTVTATNFILSSDERLKNSVEEVDNKHIDVNWKTFEMNSNQGQKRYGVIAQELEEVHPEFVRTDDEGMKSVAYVDLLIAKNAELEARLERLEKLLENK